MSLSDLAALGSFISGFAVLISLVFLYFQLRQVSAQVTQSEKNQRALMNQGIISRTVDILMHNSQPLQIQLRVKVNSHDPNFTEEDAARLFTTLRMVLINVQDAYIQHKSGLIDQITLDNSLYSVKRGFLAHPVFRAVWMGNRANFAPEFASFIDKVIDETPLAEPTDVLAQLEANLAKLKPS